MDETLRRAAPMSFAIALLCFLLPFVHVSCSGHTVADVRGVELAIGATKPPPPSSGATTPIEVRPHATATLAMLSALVALGATARRRWRAEGLAAIAALLGASFLVLLRNQVEASLAQNRSLSVSFRPGYWFSLVALLAGAGALFVRAGLAQRSGPPPPDERDPTTIPPEPRAR